MTPPTVAVDERRFCIEVTVSRPTTVLFESTGWSAYSPPGLGTVMTWTTSGPCGVKTSWRVYVIPGASETPAAPAVGTKTPARRAAIDDPAQHLTRDEASGTAAWQRDCRRLVQTRTSRYSVSRCTGVLPSALIARMKSSVDARCVVPAAETTFSSIITEPRSLAPNSSATCPTFMPCVTHDDWMWSKLSRTMRLTACVSRYSTRSGGASTSGAEARASGWKVQEMNARKPRVSSCSSRMRRMCSMRSASVSTWPYIIVAVVACPPVRVPHDAEPVGGLRLLRRDDVADAVDEDLGAAAGNRVEPRVAQPRQRAGTGSFERRAMCWISGGDSACSWIG